ncbi:hypothetical protein PE067_16710 [Paracoccus sp. DMF-8]|uniref:hypothetical protein n=1 Tax=Paracoccus sp. DMF-8 TaxID=3019445 RepID=UPI0023E4789C|nr:hypothetical protein [Paracoccus sp. DMF-8]MDF3607642.1 hypothetical protein [Paracoccus sp. DMF-8]
MHLIRHSPNFCSWKDRKAVAADLRPIYKVPSAEEAATKLISATATSRRAEVLSGEWVGARNQLAIIFAGRFDRLTVSENRMGKVRYTEQ